MSGTIDLTQEDPEDLPPTISISTTSLSHADQTRRCIDAIDLTTESDQQPDPSFREPPRKRRRVAADSMITISHKPVQYNGEQTDTSNDIDVLTDDLLQLITQPGFPGLTQEFPEAHLPATSHPARIVSPISTASICSDEQMIRCVDVIDLTTGSDEQPGPSFHEPCRKRLIVLEARLTNPSNPEPDIADQLGSTDDFPGWSETQQERWDQVSWSNDDYDEDVVRARQTPYPFDNLHDAEEVEEEEVVEEEEEEEEEEEVVQPTPVRNDQPCIDNALIHAFINRLIAQGDEIRNRTEALHTEYRAQLDVYYTSLCRRIDEGFNTINARMDVQDSNILELQGILYELDQRLENSIQRLQASWSENHEKVVCISSDQLRERRLIVNLLGVLSSDVHRR
ncbi:hypothetical protein R3I94_018464 [Phoxinus phoxinus]